MLINLDNINLEEYDLYTQDTETILNKKFMGEGYAETCFVSDMSTGYSGNMGFKIPNNWNLDQFLPV